MSYREGRFWQPDVTVATVVVRDGRLLCVEERVNGDIVINQPAGHLEPDESLVDAALRETREETGWDIRLTAFIGAYQWKAPAQPDGSADVITCVSPSRRDPLRLRSCPRQLDRRHHPRALDDADRADRRARAPPQPAGLAGRGRLPRLARGIRSRCCSTLA